jgi:hypothetical protein
MEEIADFENRFALKLPDNYRQFILHSNGGVPSSIYYLENGADIVLNEILPLKNSLLSVESYLDDLEGKYPQMIPFAEDAFGNLIMLSCNSESLYFLDHETEELRTLGTDFSNFLNQLTDQL